MSESEIIDRRSAGRKNVKSVQVEVVDDDLPEFFAPVSSDTVDLLIGQYQQMRGKLERLAELVGSDAYEGAIGYFLEGNSDKDRRHSMVTVERLFQLPGAVAQLNSYYWGRALALTDVYEAMPQARRNEWNESIRENKTPEFTEENVRSTLQALLASRSKFFAERVDGIFRGLSRGHLTNQPEGFAKRMIMTHVLGYIDHRVHHATAGVIYDLRCVLAKFMGRDEPTRSVTETLILAVAKNTGQWFTVDGGAMKIRVYKNGNGHIEIHPEMAYRLNMVLAQLYPLAIPSEFRERPKKRPKEFVLLQKPLPFQVLDVLAHPAYGYRPGSKVFTMAWEAKKLGQAYEQACAVLELMGGVQTEDREFTFDYPVDSVLQEVLISGSVPDHRAHQFYPTRDHLGAMAAELAEIGDDDSFLEPSAGRGDLAKHLPIERTTCVEIAALHCEILRARGFNTIQADFLAWAQVQAAAGTRFDRIVLNPPFADGRARLHVEAAASLLATRGILVAIMPASHKGKDFLKGFDHEWSKVYDGEFAGTSVSVVLLKARRPA